MPYRWATFRRWRVNTPSTVCRIDSQSIALIWYAVGITSVDEWSNDKEVGHIFGRQVWASAALQSFKLRRHKVPHFKDRLSHGDLKLLHLKETIIIYLELKNPRMWHDLYGYLLLGGQCTLKSLHKMDNDWEWEQLNVYWQGLTKNLAKDLQFFVRLKFFWGLNLILKW